MMAFNPKEHLTNLNGREYLEVKWRLVWFRENHPSGSITTDLVSIEPPIVKATIADEAGRILATGLASAILPPSGNAVWKTRLIEKAETAAIGRALAVAGYGTQFSDDDEGDFLADSPVEQKRAQPERRTQPPQPERPAKPANVVPMPQPGEATTTRAALSPDKLVKLLKTKATTVEADVTIDAHGIIEPMPEDDAQQLAIEMQTIMDKPTRIWILNQAFGVGSCKDLNPREAAAIRAWLAADKVAARSDAESVKAMLARAHAPAEAK